MSHLKWQHLTQLTYPLPYYLMKKLDDIDSHIFSDRVEGGDMINYEYMANMAGLRAI